MTRGILILSVCSTLYGSDACLYRVETLINGSLKTYPSIQSSRYSIQGADAQIDGAKWSYFPTPSVDISQASGRRATTMRLDQPLWTGGKLDAAVDIAQSHKNEAVAALDESGYALIENLLNVLQNYLQSEGSIEALKEGKEQLETLNRMLERRIDAGVSSLADRELLKSRLIQINSDLAVAISKRKTTQAQLELLIGSKLSCGVDTANTALLDQSIPVDVMIDRMIATHPTLKKFSEQIKTAEAEKAKAKAVMWPNLSLRAEHQSGSVYYDQSTTNNLVYIAVTASTGAGLSAFSGIQSAEAKVLQVQSDKMTKELELTDALMRDFNEYHSSMDKIEGMGKTIDASQNVLESYTRLFVAGKRQWLDLVNSSRELTQNKLSLSDMKASYIASMYRLALKNGNIKLESGEKK